MDEGGSAEVCGVSGGPDHACIGTVLLRYEVIWTEMYGEHPQHWHKAVSA